jgi:hypothetical protein
MLKCSRRSEGAGPEGPDVKRKFSGVALARLESSLMWVRQKRPAERASASVGKDHTL